MGGPTPLEIQDALYGRILRVSAWSTLFIAAIAFLAPWEVTPDKLSWTWDVWKDQQAFFVVPLVGAVLLAALGAFEFVPGIAVGGLGLAAGLVWILVAADSFAPLFAALGPQGSDQEALPRVAIPLLLAGLAYRRVLHRSIVARVLVVLGALGTAALYFLPASPDGPLVARVVVWDPLSAGKAVPVAAAAPYALLLLAAVASLLTLLPSPRGAGGWSSLALVLIHGIAAATAFAFLPPMLAGLGEVRDLSYAYFAAPLRVGALWYTCLLWLGLGAGVLLAAVEGLLRRGPVAGYRTLAMMGPPPEPAIVRRGPMPVPEQVVAMPGAAPPPALQRSGPDDTPLPPPPDLGLGAPQYPEPIPVATGEAGDVVEISAKDALPIIEPKVQPAPAAPALVDPFAAPAAVPPMAAGAPAAGARPFRVARTQIGMPLVAPPAMPGMDGSGVDQAGRVPDTMLGVPALRPAAQPAPAAPAPPGGQERKSQRLWPPPAMFPPTGGVDSTAPPPAEQKAAAPAAEAPRRNGSGRFQLPATSASAPPAEGAPRRTGSGRFQIPSAAAAAPAPAPVRFGSPAQVVSQDTPESIRFRISNLQRQLARGAISADEYQRRLDEILKGGGRK